MFSEAQQREQSLSIEMRADDGEVEFVGLEDVAGHEKDVVGAHLIDSFEDFLKRPDFTEVDNRRCGMLGDMITCFERERHRAADVRLCFLKLLG